MTILDQSPASNAIGLALLKEQASTATGNSKSLHGLSKLMLDIAEARQKILTNQAQIDTFHERMFRELKPIGDQYLATRIETLQVLAGYLTTTWIKKREAKRLHQVLCEMADDLEDEFGVDLDLERTTLLGQPLLSDEDRKAFKQMEEFFHAEFEDLFTQGNGPQSKPNERSEWGDEEEPRQHRKKGAHAKGPLKPKGEEALSGDIRALYLLLARALHPDKESDEARKQEKTTWMQKVTVAYGARNLADLLDIMARNPLDAVGPYLSQAPLKTVQGFAKRLRRELTVLRKQANSVWDSVPYDFQHVIGPEGVNEKALKGLISEERSRVKFAKKQLEAHRIRSNVERFLPMLGKRDWRGLI